MAVKELLLVAGGLFVLGKTGLLQNIVGGIPLQAPPGTPPGSGTWPTGLQGDLARSIGGMIAPPVEDTFRIASISPAFGPPPDYNPVIGVEVSHIGPGRSPYRLHVELWQRDAGGGHYIGFSGEQQVLFPREDTEIVTQGVVMLRRQGYSPTGSRTWNATAEVRSGGLLNLGWASTVLATATMPGLITEPSAGGLQGGW